MAPTEADATVKVADRKLRRRDSRLGRKTRLPNVDPSPEGGGSEHRQPCPARRRPSHPRRGPDLPADPALPGAAGREHRLLSLTLLLECLLLASVWDGGTAAVNIGGWLPPWGIVMVVDQFSSLMLVVSSAVSLAVLIYATGQGMADGDEDAPVSIFHPTYLILVAGVSNAFLSGDLFNLYVGFEILLTASYVLMTLGGTGPAHPCRRDLRGGLAWCPPCCS